MGRRRSPRSQALLLDERATENILGALCVWDGGRLTIPDTTVFCYSSNEFCGVQAFSVRIWG
jgi:hypothetical protein